MTSVYFWMTWICFFFTDWYHGIHHHAFDKIWGCHFKGTFSKHHGQPNLRWYSKWMVGTITMGTWISFRPCHRENYDPAQRKMALHLKSKVATFEDTTIFDWTIILGGRVTWFAWKKYHPCKKEMNQICKPSFRFQRLNFGCVTWSLLVWSSAPSHELLCILVVLGGGGGAN